MASSSLCGPTNALQNLSKHTAVDRSLQQDRLRSPAPSGSQQGFRAQHNHQLDSEFQQFNSSPIQHAASPPPHLAHQLHHQHSAPQMHSPTMDGWATDFQRLSLNTTRTRTPMQNKGKQPAMSAWDAEFLKFQQQQQQSQPQTRTQSPMQRGPVMGGMNGGMMGMQQPMMPMQPMYQPQYSMQIAPQTHYAPAVETQTQQQQVEQVNKEEMDAAFDAAFDAVLEEESEQLSAESQHDTLDALEASLQTSEPQHEALDAETLLQTPEPQIAAPIQPEPIVQEEPMVEQQEEPKQDVNDELSKTAGELLNSVSNDTSTKFQNSKFLELMRRLRDREVRVEGDKVVENAGAEQ